MDFNRYLEDVEILETRFDEFEAEHEVQLKVKGMTLICFDPINHDDILAGNKMKLVFSLLSGYASKSENVKSIKPSEVGDYLQRWWGSHYKVTGELVAILSYAYLWEGKIRNKCMGVVDCGILINDVCVSTYDQLKIGDYVTAEGRLDIYNPYF